MKRENLAILILCLILAGSVFPKVISIPPSRKNIEGTWLGFTSDGNRFYRISLHEKDGILASSFAGEAPLLYRFESWSLSSKGEVKVFPVPVSTNAFAIRLSGKATASKIFIKVAALEGGWSEELMLQREELIEKRFLELRKAMKEMGRLEEP